MQPDYVVYHVCQGKEKVVQLVRCRTQSYIYMYSVEGTVQYI